MMTGNLIHCVCGPIAAGKSTLARSLAESNSGVRFAIDEWMHALYGPDRPESMNMGWLVPRLARCHDMIWSVASQVLARGKDVVMEPGLMTQAERAAFRAQAEAAGRGVRMHFVDAPRDVRLARLNSRNLERGETFSFEVTPAMFEFMEARYEAPSEDECAQAGEWARTSGE